MVHTAKTIDSDGKPCLIEVWKTEQGIFISQRMFIHKDDYTENLGTTLRTWKDHHYIQRYVGLKLDTLTSIINLLIQI